MIILFVVLIILTDCPLHRFRTFTYVENEMEKIPVHIPVLVLGNHRDMGHHRTVLEDKARYFGYALSQVNIILLEDTN